MKATAVLTVTIEPGDELSPSGALCDGLVAVLHKAMGKAYGTEIRSTYSGRKGDTHTVVIKPVDG